MSIVSRATLVAAAVALLVVALYLGATRTALGQDFLLRRALSAGLEREPLRPIAGGLTVFMCGTASPLAGPGQAQACVAVLVDDRIVLVDAGAGSNAVAAAGGLPMERVETLLLTHFHSDHIAALADVNLGSWVAGRPVPLRIVGPPGVTEVVEAFNSAYAHDRDYRVAHHGADLLPPDLHRMDAHSIEPGVILEEDGLVVRAFAVDHRPVTPAVGYRFDYAGRSVVVTGDTVVTEGVVEVTRGADLVLADALSLPIVQAMEEAARAAGRSRQERIFQDIQDYHAATEDLASLVGPDGARRLGLYHLVPAPRNALMERIFVRDAPEGTILTRDGMVIDLPPGSTAVAVR